MTLTLLVAAAAVLGKVFHVSNIGSPAN
jgi:hypothetical protein